MKSRLGFVSNSSSSSFLIYGIMLDSEYFEKFYEEDKDFNEYEYIDELLEKNGISHYENAKPYDNEWFIGCSWSAVKDDQTGKQFKEEVEANLKKVFGENLEFNTYEEAWSDY